MKTIKSILVTVFITIFSFQLNAQRTYTIVDSKSTFEVAGTSTVHDWTMRSTEGTGIANLTVKDSKLTAINSLTISLLAESLKSGKTSMDEVAYEALDTQTHKSIDYTLKSAEKINDSTWILTGTYTVAGVSKEYKTQVKVTTSNTVIILQDLTKLLLAILK